MWVVNEKGTALNLSKFCCIYVEHFSVIADLSGSDEEAYCIKEFDNKVDAKEYLAELVEKLNAEQTAGVCRDEKLNEQGKNAKVQKATDDFVAVMDELGLPYLVLIANNDESAKYVSNMNKLEYLASIICMCGDWMAKNGITRKELLAKIDSALEALEALEAEN